MSQAERHDDDVVSVLNDDGVEDVIISDHENQPMTRLTDLVAELGDGSWATRLIYNQRYGGVLIRQMPGEGNRLHYHNDADECWVILAGEGEWYIEGKGTNKVKPLDIVVVTQGTNHKITCVGAEPGMRLAITKPDVDHIYPAD